jgi:hypothetical protein
MVRILAPEKLKPMAEKMNGFCFQKAVAKESLTAS